MQVGCDDKMTTRPRRKVVSEKRKYEKRLLGTRIQTDENTIRERKDFKEDMDWTEQNLLRWIGRKER